MADQAQDVVRTRRLEVVDSDGKARASIDVDDKNAVSLKLYKPGGTVPASAVATLPDGSSTLVLNRDGGKAAVLLTASPDGLYGLVLVDQNGVPRVYVALTADGAPTVSVLDGDQQSVWKAP